MKIGKETETAETGKHSRRRMHWLPVRFVLVFLISFLILQRSYIKMRADTGDRINQLLNAMPAAGIINLITPGETVRAVDAKVMGSYASVEIMKGCEGFEVFFVLLAAFAAFPMPWRRKLLGILTGFVFVYGLNLIRIVSLYYMVRFKPDRFDMAHITIWQTVMILAAALFFLFFLPKSPVRKQSICTESE